MSRRREAEGSIYTGKCQGTKQWPILPHHSIKCIKYLGFIISIDRIKADPEKIAVIN
jgi:hypothetical protein